MSTASGKFWVVFNGEIYNYKALREELQLLGHRFRSSSDTEVLLHGFQSWGTSLFSRLRGMFAIALWDVGREALILARDRLGKKPLFHCSEDGQFAFGSELGVFKHIPGFSPKLSIPAFLEYVEYGYVHSPGTLIAGISRLPAGHFLTWTRDSCRTDCFWSLPRTSSRPAKDSPVEAAEALDAVLEDAVRTRLQADVPLGCFLSGGVDSSLVAAVAQQNLAAPLKTYTVRFENSNMNEADHAQRVAEYLRTDHHELPVNASSVLNEFESILSLTSEPIGDDSFVPTYLISRETRHHVTVALSGDGGDELFAGYTKYRQFEQARRLQKFPMPWQWLSPLAFNDRMAKALAALSISKPSELARWLSSLWKRVEIQGILNPSISGTIAEDAFDRSWNTHAGYAVVERWMRTDMETYLEGDILTKVDRASMAVGLEVRSPFLDSELIHHALQWSSRADSRHGGKGILRSLLARRMPATLFERPKQGFGMPVAEWFRGPLRATLQRFTDPERLERQGLFDGGVIRKKVQQHLAGKNLGRKLYSLVAFQIWVDGFFGKDAVLH